MSLISSSFFFCYLLIIILIWSITITYVQVCHLWIVSWNISYIILISSWVVFIILRNLPELMKIKFQFLRLLFVFLSFIWLHFYYWYKKICEGRGEGFLSAMVLLFRKMIDVSAANIATKLLSLNLSNHFLHIEKQSATGKKQTWRNWQCLISIWFSWTNLGHWIHFPNFRKLNAVL